MDKATAEVLFEYREGALFWKKSGWRCKVGTKAGWIGNRGYWMVQIKGKNYLEHRLIFLMHHGYCPDILDHIDRNKQNNKIENLRQVAHSLNIHNQRGWASTGLLGAYKRRNGKFLSGITKNGKQYWLGTFDTAKEAHEAHLEAARRLYG